MAQKQSTSNSSESLDDLHTQFEEIEPVKLHELTQERYLNYAMSVITSRALPDVRDGLKPVQRRILYAMYHDLKLRSDSRYLKSARVVGDVMGKYHPHGDQSIYDAMVRMSQPFSLRYPLIDGYGNFGSLDGDSAAAMRYTEARLGGMAERLLAELGQQTIDHRANYDGQLEEPAVLPAQVPNLLINGATGIAVGMATHIPPHNLREVVAALLKLIKNPDLSTQDLIKTIQGPDFPTGGEILNTTEDLAKIYSVGKGAIKVRGTYEVEKTSKSKQIIITSIPYEVQKGNLVEKIAQLVIERKLPQIVDVRDESTDQVRIVLELKRKENPEMVMSYLYKYTPLQNNFNLNLTCLIPEGKQNRCKPDRIGLKELLNHFLTFRMQVVKRRLNHILAQLKKAIHRLEAFEIIYGALDEAIELIRKSEGRADAQNRLMHRFDLDESQAQSILDLRLYRLAKLEIIQVQSELKDKRQKAEEHQRLLGDEEALWNLIRDELREVRKQYGDERKTLVSGPQDDLEFSPEAYIVKENTWVIVSRKGRVKRQRGFSELSAIRVPEGDEVGWAFYTDTRKTITFFTQNGSAYSHLIGDLVSTTGYGDPVQSIFRFSDGERIVGVTVSDPLLYPQPLEFPEESKGEMLTLDGVLDHEQPKYEGPFGIALTLKGKIHRFPLSSFSDVSQKNGRRYMALEGKDEVVACYAAVGDESVALASRQGRGMIFSIYHIPLRQRSSKGCIAIKLTPSDDILGFVLTNDPMKGLTVHTGSGREFLIRESYNRTSKFRKTRRGGRGSELIRRGQFEKWDNPVIVLDRPAASTSSKSKPSDESKSTTESEIASDPSNSSKSPTSNPPLSSDPKRS